MDVHFTSTIAHLAILVPAFLLALSFHEFAHAYIATLLGDDTPKQMGRVTLNPLAHIDPIGFLFLIMFHVGWAKQVTFDHRNFKHPCLYTVITAFIGPIANFLLALICFYGLFYLPVMYLSKAVALTCQQILLATAQVNIMLGVFNFLPIPPLDGSHVLLVFFVDKFPNLIHLIYQYSLFILVGLFLFPQVRTLFMQGCVIVEILLKKLVI